MKKFGTLNGFDVYKVDKFNPQLAKQGIIQLVDNGENYYWKIHTVSSDPDGIYSSDSGITTFFDDNEFLKNLDQLKRIIEQHKVEPISKPKPKFKPVEYKLDGVVEEIMGEVRTSCEELLSRIEAVG